MRSLKILILMILAGFPASFALSQNTYNKGDMVISLGTGLGSNFYTGSYYTSRLPYFSGSFDVGVKDELFNNRSSLGLGIYAGYTGAEWDNGLGWNYATTILGARSDLHYHLIDKLDTYTGILLGVKLSGVKSSGFGSQLDNYSKRTSGFIFSWLLGGKYYFYENFAGFLELSTGVAYFSAGIAIKL